MASSEKGATTMREEIAALMHEIWSGWMEYMFQHCTLELIEGKGSNVIPEHCVRRWSRQIDTPYADLSDDEKDSDRRVADKVLALVEKRAFDGGCTSALVWGPDVLAGWLAYIEEDGSPVSADILQCQSCGNPSSSLTTWTIKDDEGEKIVWLCESCQSTKNLTEVYREDADCEKE